MIDLTKKDRSRQDSVWVNDIEYKIHTEFYHWLCFEKHIKSVNDRLEKGERVLYAEFDQYYEFTIPDDRAIGYNELVKFWQNEQPLPRDIGKASDVKTLDWEQDSERIRAKFLSVYRIDLITTDLHYFDFMGLFNALFWDLNGVVSARLRKEKPDKVEKMEKENRDMWALDNDKEVKIFKMR